MQDTKRNDHVLLLRKQGLSYKEIAKRIDITPENARMIASRAKKQQQHTSPCPAGVCKVCGDPLTFVEGKKRKQFCSDACRTKYQNQRKKRTPHICTCELCGKEFVYYGNPHKRFCSQECLNLFKRRG